MRIAVIQHAVLDNHASGVTGHVQGLAARMHANLPDATRPVHRPDGEGVGCSEWHFFAGSTGIVQDIPDCGGQAFF